MDSPFRCAKKLSCYDHSGDIIGHTTPIKSEDWGTGSHRGASSARSSGDIIGHTSSVVSNDFDGWQSKKKYSDKLDSGDIIGHVGELRSAEFQDVKRRGKPAAIRSSGDIINLRSDTLSNSFIGLEVRKGKSPVKYKDNISSLFEGKEFAIPETPTRTFGKRVERFPSNLPTAEDLKRTPKKTAKKIILGMTATTLDKEPAPSRLSKKPIEEARGQKQHASVLNPESRSDESEMSSRDYLGSRKKRLQQPSTKHDDERRPAKKFEKSKDHGDLVAHDGTPRSLERMHFSKKVFEQSRDNESKGSYDEVLRFRKKIFRDRPQSAGLLQHSEDVPAPVARPPTAHLTARELRAGLGTARQRRHQNHGDIVGWRDLAL